MNEPMTAQQILSVLIDCERIIQTAGPKPCGMRLTEHQFQLERIRRARDTISNKIAEARR